MSVIHVHTTNGHYLGFISGGNLFSRDSEYLGWLEGKIVWDKNGNYRGNLQSIGGHYYILKPSFLINPIPRIPHIPPISPIPPIPPQSITPIIVPLGTEDGFSTKH